MTVSKRLASPISTVVLFIVAFVLAVQDLEAREAPERRDSRVSYAREVRPILAEHCYVCHGPDRRKRKAKLRLDTAEGLASNFGDYGITVPGDLLASELYQRITTTDPLDRMPPPKHGAALSPAEIDVLRRWIEEGAEWEAHWAFAPFRAVEVPEVSRAGSVRNPIDSFVYARLEALGRHPAPEADPRTLIRRLSLDLVGMPPTPEEVAEFESDDVPDAYERLVERLLASPHYAERWARHWLDLARYADSNGFTIDGLRVMWPYRDWVVRAIDEDLPFDRFTTEQLAGDLLPQPTNAQRVATGFHRNTQINEEGGAKDEENRVNAVIDRVDTTAAVWLGSTLACARCHDHKFDPVSQKEYFSLFALFNQTEDGGTSTGPTVQVTDESSAPILAAYESKRAELLEELRAAERAAALGWRAWSPASLRGSNGPELRLEEDGSIRVIGHNPVTSVFVLEGSAPAAGLRALRLEALPDMGLGGGGPGRSSTGNFVLERVRLYGREAGDEAPFRELSFARASADHSQAASAQGEDSQGGESYPVSGALDDEPGTGWAIGPRFGEPHVAHFELSEALPPGDWELRLELHQDWGQHHLLGRFRVAFDEPGQELGAATVPVAWTSAWRASVEQAGDRPALSASLVMKERATPRTTRLMKRGNFLDLGEIVEGGVPAAMNGFGAQETPRNRLDLARWLTDPRNALVHRVTVNRWWQQFFGTGLVETESDFGTRGAEPTHPEILEWLAAELVRCGFSRKALHRLIVSSATYRQATRPADGTTRDEDPHNRLLARQSRLRLDAECIRDSALRASGLLDATFGGPPVQPPQPEGVFDFTQADKGWKADEGGNRFRRTLYTRIWRSSTFPFLVTFDAPVANVTCTRRGRSNTPLQALTLANDPMMLELASGLGRRARAGRRSDEERLRYAFELCLTRAPVPAELDLLGEHLETQRRRHQALGLEEEAVEERSWTAIGRVLFNLDEFLTRE